MYLICRFTTLLAGKFSHCRTWQVVTACNQDCNCDHVPVSPSSLVCSLQGTVATVFLSPCHAGCSLPPVESAYTNCSCVGRREEAANTSRAGQWRDLSPRQLRARLGQPADTGTVSHGPCPQSNYCRINFYLYVTILMVGTALMVGGPLGQTKLLFLLRSVEQR